MLSLGFLAGEWMSVLRLATWAVLILVSVAALERTLLGSAKAATREVK